MLTITVDYVSSLHCAQQDRIFHIHFRLDIQRCRHPRIHVRVRVLQINVTNLHSNQVCRVFCRSHWTIISTVCAHHRTGLDTTESSKHWSPGACSSQVSVTLIQPCASSNQTSRPPKRPLPPSFSNTLEARQPNKFREDRKGEGASITKLKNLS